MVDIQVCQATSTHQAIRQEGGLVKGTSVKKLVGIPTQAMNMKGGVMRKLGGSVGNIYIYVKIHLYTYINIYIYREREMYICIVKTKKICIYMSYIIHGPGQCAIFPQPTCFRSFRNIPLIKLFFWGQFGSGQCKKNDHWQEYPLMTLHDI